MGEPKFVPKTIYVIYIASTPEKVWEVVMDPERLKDWVTIHRKLGRSSKAPLKHGSKLEQTLHLTPVRKIAALNPMAQHIFAIFLQSLVIRRLVNAIHRRAIQAHQPRRHRLVRQQHELLDKLMRNIVLHPLDSQYFAALVQPDF